MKKQNFKFTAFLIVLAILTNNSAFGSSDSKGASEPKGIGSVLKGINPVLKGIGSAFKSDVHEISFYGTGGLSSFRYDIPDAKVSSGAGLNFGVGYNFFFNPKWGVHAGMGLGSYRTTVKLNNSKIVSYNLVDDEGDRFDMHTTLFGYNETKKTMCLNIPIMAMYRTTVQKQPVYAMGGIKMGIPISSKYSGTSARLQNSSFYPDYNNWVHSHEFTGNSEFFDRNFEGKFKFGTSLMLALEAGARVMVYKDFPLNVGVFFDYGLNNVIKEKNQPFIDYTSSNPADFNASLFSASDKAKPIAVGITLRTNVNYQKIIRNRRAINPYRRSSY